MEKLEGVNLWLLDENSFLHFIVSGWIILQPRVLSICFSVGMLNICVNNISVLMKFHKYKWILYCSGKYFTEMFNTSYSTENILAKDIYE